MRTNHLALLFALALPAVFAASCTEKQAAPGGQTASPDATAQAPAAVPQAEIQIEGVPTEEQPALKNLLRVDGVMRRGNEFVVALNGQVVKAGEFLRLKVKRRDYILEVLNIESDRILLRATAKGDEKTVPPVPSPLPKAAQ